MQSELDRTGQERDQLKQQLANAQSQLQDSKQQIEAARRAAHQPPPPPPPEDQVPIKWQSDFQLNWSAGPKFIWMRFIGQATGLAQIKDTYIISALTGHREQLKVSNPADVQDTMSIDQIEPVTTGAPIYLIFQWAQPLAVADFFNQWGAFEFHVLYENKEYVRSYSQEYINDKLAREMAGIIGPRVTKKQENK